MEVALLPVVVMVRTVSMRKYVDETGFGAERRAAKAAAPAPMVTRMAAIVRILFTSAAR
jgi:hypothetical protein